MSLFDDLPDFDALDLPDDGSWPLEPDLTAGYEPGPDLVTEAIEFGDPASFAQHHVVQSEPFSCAVAVQTSVLRAAGLDVSEEALLAEAESAGWYQPQVGTLVGDVGKLVEANGVSTETVEAASISDLAVALERGDVPMVGVDASELSGLARDPVSGAPLELSDVGHLVAVTGLDVTEEGDVAILLSDPASNSAVTAVPFDAFVHAWDDYDNHLVVARVGQ